MYDGNGNEVADGTPVTLRRFDRGEGLFLPDVEVVTESGRATGIVRAERAGELEVTAVFANGLHSAPLNIGVEGGSGTAEVPAEPAADARVVARPPVDWAVLLLSLTAILMAGAVLVGADPAAAQAPSRLLRLFLMSLCLGLGGYLLVAAGGVTAAALASSRLWPSNLGATYQAPVFSFGFAMLVVVPAIIMDRRRGRASSVESLPSSEHGQ
jgi:hypothetical protein